MKKETLIGAVVLAAILGGVIFYGVTNPSPAKAPGTSDLSALSGTSHVEHAEYYDIAVNYASSTPLLSSAGTSADTAAIALMKKFVADTIAQFKTDGNFANLTAADIQTMGLGPDRKETLQIRYLIASSPRTVSYIFTVYTDTLGAHSNTSFRTFTFDTSTGAPLALADLFAPGSNYLAKLSSISRAKLPNIIGDGTVDRMLADGTTPDEENFANFFIDNNQLVTLFDPYQVAPYSAGPQTLYIPLSELRDILKSEYR